MAQAAQMSKDSKYGDARAAFTNAANIKADGPGNPGAGVLRMELAEGLEQFYSGHYDAAIQHLEKYAQSTGEKQPLAHFYLGASKLARFYVTGSEDAGLQKDALKDLAEAKQAGFEAESQEVSPKILQAYHDLEFSSAR
jgi:TolA-binding protein